MGRSATLLPFGLVLVGCAHLPASTPAPSPPPRAALVDAADAPAEPSPEPAIAPVDVPVPDVVHRTEPFQFAYARDADVAIAISDEGHAAMFAPSDGRVRASRRISDGSFEEAIRILSADGARAVVGSLRETGDPDRLELWRLDADVTVDLLAELREAAPLYVLADPEVRSVFVALEARASADAALGEAAPDTLRYARLDAAGRVVCTSAEFARRGPEEAIVAADGSALFLDAIAGDAARRVDARSCADLPLDGVDYVLATRPNSGQMLTRDVDGTLALRSPRDGSVLARVPLEHHVTRAVYDPTGTFVAVSAASVAIVLSALDGSVVHAAIPITGTLRSIASDGRSLLFDGHEGTVLVDAVDGTTLRRPAPVHEPGAGAAERRIWRVIPFPDRDALVVVTARAVVEWSARGARRIDCGGSSIEVVEIDGGLRAIAPTSICDLDRGQSVEREVIALDDDGTHAIVVGDAGADGEHAMALFDVGAMRVRATLPVVPSYTSGAAIARRSFTADGRFAIVRGADRTVIVDVHRGRVAHTLPPSIVAVRGRTPDGSAFVVELDDAPPSGSPLRRIDPRRPAHAEVYEGPVDEGPPEAAHELGIDGGATRIEVGEEAVRLSRVDGSDALVLRTVHSEDPSIPSYSFAADAAGRVYLEGAGIGRLHLRRAGDARSAALVPAVDDESVRARLARLLGARDPYTREAQASAPR